MKFINQIITVSLFVLTNNVMAYNEKQKENCEIKNEVYVFSWELSNDCDDKPRGGTSKGADIVFDTEIHAGWKAIQEKGLSKKQKDRKTILAMSGPYRVDFNFLETVGFSKDYKRDTPYHSWGTEYVYVIENTENFISLQHIMVIYMKQDDGKISGPFVMKHWRQDWTYEDSTLLVYENNNSWKKVNVSDEHKQGKWSQAVFQVDDSPRYESIGKWEHNESFSSWISEKTNRPLPRREYSIRKDYDVLEGFNRHTINRYGWVQEEENWKKRIDSTNNTVSYLSKEEGIGRYQRIVETDFTPGDEYFNSTSEFWSDVRNVWNEVFIKHDQIKLAKTVDGQPLFMPLFEYAQKVHDEKKYDKKIGKKYIEKIIYSYLVSEKNNDK